MASLRDSHTTGDQPELISQKWRKYVAKPRGRRRDLQTARPIGLAVKVLDSTRVLESTRGFSLSKIGFFCYDLGFNLQTAETTLDVIRRV